MSAFNGPRAYKRLDEWGAGYPDGFGWGRCFWGSADGHFALRATLTAIVYLGGAADTSIVDMDNENDDAPLLLDELTVNLVIKSNRQGRELYRQCVPS